MLGQVGEWFYRSLLGINTAAPGFEKIIIKPQPAGDLVKDIRPHRRKKHYAVFEAGSGKYSFEVRREPVTSHLSQLLFHHIMRDSYFKKLITCYVVSEFLVEAYSRFPGMHRECFITSVAGYIFRKCH